MVEENKNTTKIIWLIIAIVIIIMAFISGSYYETWWKCQHKQTQIQLPTICSGPL